jgi:hypothetical protein
MGETVSDFLFFIVKTFEG